jgi:uncharacterized protein
MTEAADKLTDWQPRLAALAAGAAGSDGAHDASHLERVWRNAQARRSARLAHHQLGWMAFPAELLDGVAHAIEAHSFSAGIPAETIEAKIVQDADRLDALGAVGLARVFYVSGQLGRPLAHPDDPLARDRPLDDSTYALDHFALKLAALPGMMQTDAGRQLAQQRVQLLMDFRATFADEWSAAPPDA